MKPSRAFPLIFSLLFPIFVNADVTIYTTLSTPTPVGAPTTVDSAVPTTLRAYNNVICTPPAVPDPPPPNNFPINLGPNGMNNLSLPQLGSYVGYSIELSVSNQVLGRNSTLIQVPFLNALANLRARAGQGAAIRVGGNSQESSLMFGENGFGNFRAINKTKDRTTDNPTATPDLDYQPDIFTLMLHVSELVDTNWFFGLPFADATNTTGIAEIAATAETILGTRLLALQLGNEPDLYDVNSRRRTPPYAISNFMNEWGASIQAMAANPGVTRSEILLGPSPCCNIPDWGIYDVLDAGFLTSFMDNLSYFSIQHYPTANCGDEPIDAQTQVASYYTHTNAVNFAAPYFQACAVAQAAGKPCIMFETNTASCGGYAGLSDAFGAALWGIDMALQTAFANFTNILFHTGGQGVAYNPFTAPPSNIAKNHSWTFGPLYYTSLVATEIFGSTNKSRVVDLFANNNNEFTPAYAIYEDGVPTKVALINFVDDLGTGANAYTANIAIGGGDTGFPSSTPSTVSVRYLAAPSVSEKFNITWAGQTMGGRLAADGILKGDVLTQTIQCDTNAGTCPIRVPAPGFALVFLNDDAVKSSSPPPEDSTFTFPTTTGKKKNTATVNQGVLATSNGRGGPDSQAVLGSTSKEKLQSGARRVRGEEVMWALVAGVAAVGAWAVGRAVAR